MKISEIKYRGRSYINYIALSFVICTICIWFQDESLAERLLGLTEMFPEEVRNLGYNVGTCLSTCMKGL